MRECVHDIHSVAADIEVAVGKLHCHNITDWVIDAIDEPVRVFDADRVCDAVPEPDELTLWECVLDIHSIVDFKSLSVRQLDGEPLTDRLVDPVLELLLFWYCVDIDSAHALGFSLHQSHSFHLQFREWVAQCHHFLHVQRHSKLHDFGNANAKPVAVGLRLLITDFFGFPNDKSLRVGERHDVSASYSYSITVAERLLLELRVFILIAFSHTFFVAKCIAVSDGLGKSGLVADDYIVRDWLVIPNLFRDAVPQLFSLSHELR